MFLHIITIIAPVFLVIAAGYLSVRAKLLTDDMVDGLMRFAILIAVPCLLFRAIATMDLGTAFDWRLMLSFFGGATICFIMTGLLARRFFSRQPGEAVSVGFTALFSNVVLLGLPISARAWGEDQIAPLFAIVSVNAPFCYLLGITAMEWLRSDGRSWPETTVVVVKAMFRNSLMIGIGLGFLVNFSGLSVPVIVGDGVALLAGAALPVALFSLGGLLTRYRFSENVAEASMVSAVSLVLQPALALLCCTLLALEPALTAMIVLMAAMPTGLNGYLFANLYQRGQGTAASVVLLTTLLSVFSLSIWLWWLV